MTTTFSAAPQAIGYLYQARVALAMLLEAPDEAVLRVEALDDIDISGALEAGSLSLLQLKHHVAEVTLTDSDPDLWKSLRVWSEEAAQSKFAVESTKIYLFTTASIKSSSIPALLGATNRNVEEAEKRLLDISKTSSNKALASAFDAFQALNPSQRIALLSSLTIVPNSPDISGIQKRIQQQLRMAVRANFVAPFTERVEGWWLNRVILHLLGRSPNYQAGISSFELHEQVAAIAESFREESLPIDFADIDPGVEEIAASARKQYVAQLKAIQAPPRTIRKAILDYYKAYHQRHRWLRDSLVLPSELENFEDRLRDEWERYFDHHCDGIDPDDSVALVEAGKKILRWAELECNLRIRPRVEAEYIRRGSFHMLAEKLPLEIHWHPRFAELMEESLRNAA